MTINATINASTAEMTYQKPNTSVKKNSNKRLTAAAVPPEIIYLRIIFLLKIISYARGDKKESTRQNIFSKLLIIRFFSAFQKRSAIDASEKVNIFTALKK